MKKLLLILIFFTSITAAKAGNHDTYFGIASTFFYPNSVDVVFSLEKQNKYLNYWEYFLKTHYGYIGKANEYYNINLGVAYKPCFYHTKNNYLRGRFGASVGRDENFTASINLGIEYTFNLLNTNEIFIRQDNYFCFWTKNHLRHGVTIGIRFNLFK